MFGDVTKEPKYCEWCGKPFFRVIASGIRFCDGCKEVSKPEALPYYKIGQTQQRRARHVEATWVQ